MVTQNRGPKKSSVQAPPHFGFDIIDTRGIALALNASPPPKLISLCAPPGYGKSVLLSRLYRAQLQEGLHCLWVALDDRDSDLSSLLYKVRLALEGSDLLTEATLEGASISSADGLLKLLANIGSASLFVDNSGLCSDPQLAQFLSSLVFSAPELRLVVASTRELPIDMSRAKLELGALELRARHLAFDMPNARDMLEQIGITDAADSEVSQLLERTEGWPAALRLFQVLLADVEGDGSSKHTEVVRRLLQHFTGDQRDIAQLLTQRLIVRFPPEFVQFLVEIALLREFSAELAEAATGRPEAATWLNMLIGRNLLIFPLDRDRRWLRFHTLLREFLLAESSARLSESRRREILDRAAQWHAVHGDPFTALDLTLDAGNVSLARQLLIENSHIVVGDQGRMATMVHWVDRLREAKADLPPEAHGWFIWALCDSLQFERALVELERMDQRVVRQLDDAPEASAQQPTGLLFARMLVNVWADRLDDAYDQAIEWLGRKEAESPLSYSTATSIAAIAEMNRGEFGAARLRMARADALICRSQSIYGLGWVSILRACVDIEQARPDLASTHLAEARRTIVNAIGESAGVVHTLDFVRSRALIDLGRFDEARSLAMRGLSHAQSHGILTSLEQGLAAASILTGPLVASGGADVGVQLEKVVASYPARARTLWVARQVRQLLQANRLQDAEAISGAMTDPTEQSSHSCMLERGDCLLARLELRLHQGALTEVASNVRASLALAQAQERVRDIVELHLLEAEIHQRLGDKRLALRRLALAVSRAAPGQLVGPFLGRPALLQLLGDNPAAKLGLIQNTERALLNSIAASTAFPSSPSGPAEANGPASSLPTGREIGLLSLLAEGLDNEQIADRLSLSLSTVKWHLHNLYGKLGVRNRSAALARARSMDLLDH